MKFTRTIKLYFAFAAIIFISGCFSAPSGPSYPRTSPVNNEKGAELLLPNSPYGSQFQLGQVNAPHKIALLVPLSGRSQKIGQAIFDAAQMALYSSGNRDFQIMPFDTGDAASLDIAEKAANDAVAQGAEVIIGPLFSDAVNVVAPIARARGIKVFSFSNNKAVAGNGVYLLGLMPDQQIERIMQYAADRGITGISALLPDNLFGNQVAEIVRKQSAWRNVAIRRMHFYAAQRTDFSLAAKAVAEAYKAKNIIPSRNSEAVLIPEAGINLKEIYTGLNNNGFNNTTVRLLGSALWDDPEVIRDKSFAGGWYAAPPYESFDSFKRDFRSTFGYAAPDIAALGYDAVNLALQLSRSNYSSADIHSSYGFNGLRGAYRFDAKGISYRNYAIYEIRDGSSHVIDSASSGF